MTLSKNFHDKCDNQCPSITLYKNEMGDIFGGYTSIPWTSEDITKEDKDSFIFTLTNKYETKPIKFPTNRKINIVCKINAGPSFGGGTISFFKIEKFDILVKKDFIKENSLSQFPSCYEDTFGKGYSIFTSNKSNEFKILEIEVFKSFK